MIRSTLVCETARATVRPENVAGRAVAGREEYGTRVDATSLFSTAISAGYWTWFFHLRLSDLDTNQIVLNYQPMESRQASRIFEALSSDVRLDLFRLLVKNAPGGLVQGEIARQLDIPTTNLSFHLKAIVQSGLVDVEREGRFMRYKANIPLMLTIVAYLTEECCADNPEMCQRFRDCSPVKNGILPKRGG